MEASITMRTSDSSRRGARPGVGSSSLALRRRCVPATARCANTAQQDKCQPTAIGENYHVEVSGHSLESRRSSASSRASSSANRQQHRLRDRPRLRADAFQGPADRPAARPRSIASGSSTRRSTTPPRPTSSATSCSTGHLPGQPCRLQSELRAGRSGGFGYEYDFVYEPAGSWACCSRRATTNFSAGSRRRFWPPNYTTARAAPPAGHSASSDAAT